MFWNIFQVKCGVPRPTSLSYTHNNNNTRKLNNNANAITILTSSALVAETPGLSEEEAALLAKLEEANRFFFLPPSFLHY